MGILTEEEFEERILALHWEECREDDHVPSLKAHDAAMRVRVAELEKLEKLYGLQRERIKELEAEIERLKKENNVWQDH